MKNKLESLVGFIILLIAVSFSVSIYKNTGMRALEDTYNVKAKFDQVEGIVTGSDVRISGVKVGSVVTLDLDPIEYHAVMTIALNKKIKLPRDSSMKIVSSGLLGDKYVSIEMGGDKAILKQGDEVQHTQSSINIESLISKTIFNSSSRDKDQS